jgi:hypothetical protein
VLYHLLSGRPPFEAENEIQTLFVLSSGRPAPPLRGDVPPEVAAVVRRALAHAPSARFATAAEMQQALEEASAKAGLLTTSAAVAAYLAEHMGNHAEKRKEAIALGLKAATEREKYAEMMRSNTDRKTGAETSDTGMRAAMLAPGEATNPSSATGQTLGSAAVVVTPRDGSRGLRFAIVGGVVGFAIAVLALVALLGPGRDRSSAATSRPPPIASPIVVPPPTAPTPATPVLPDASAPQTASSSSATAPTPTAPPATPVARPVWTPPVPVATTAPKPAGTAKGRVNDGF